MKERVRDYNSPHLELKKQKLHKFKYKNCLRCEGTFLSEGPFNRMCNYCKKLGDNSRERFPRGWE